MCFLLDAASSFAMGDAMAGVYQSCRQAGGVFGLIAGLLGFYCFAHYLCAEVIPFGIPMGDTSHLFKPEPLRHSTRDREEPGP